MVNFFVIVFFLSVKCKENNWILLDNEDMGRVPYPTVIRQEQEKPIVTRNELTSFREMSPISQLSRSRDGESETPSVKDIQRDEPMLGFE